MIKNNKKSLILITLLVFFVFSLLSVKEAKAGTLDNTAGWAWSENIGWISFNCTNQGTCPAVDYGVKIDLVGGGIFSGYAWSENIGWISFNSAQLAGCPSGICQAKFDTATNKITGWARACAGTVNGDCNSATRTDGWDGWIHFNGTGYGVSVNASKEFEGYIWGGDVVGWISPNCITNGVCAVSPYKIVITNPPGTIPAVDALPVSPDDSTYCSNYINPPVRFNWKFSSSDPAASQSAYQIQIYSSNIFIPANLTEDTLKITNSGFSSVATNLDYGGVPYYWRIRVWDNYDVPSAWKTGPPFTTITYPYPDPEFTWIPNKIIAGNSITFTADPNTFDFIPIPPGKKTWDWDFGDGTFKSRPLGQNTIAHTYATANSGGYDIKLTATADFDGKDHSCSAAQHTRIFSPPPIWRETPPPVK